MRNGYFLKQLCEKLPRTQWQERMYLVDVDNKALLQVTGGNFPLGCDYTKRTHPIYILTCEDILIMACPCSTAETNRSACRFIRKGAVTSLRRQIKKDTFILEKYRFSVPQGLSFEELFENSWDAEFFNPVCWGLIEPQDIIAADNCAASKRGS